MWAIQWGHAELEPEIKKLCYFNLWGKPPLYPVGGGRGKHHITTKFKKIAMMIFRWVLASL